MRTSKVTDSYRYQMARQTEAFPFLRINVQRVKRNRTAIRVIEQMIKVIGGKYMPNKPYIFSDEMVYSIEYPYNDERDKRKIESRIVDACDLACEHLKLDHHVVNIPQLGYRTIIQINSEYSGVLRYVQVK